MGQWRSAFQLQAEHDGKPNDLPSGARAHVAHVPREYPWGRSVSVNTARADKVDGEMLLSVEMQSGDVIEARIGEISLAFA